MKKYDFSNGWSYKHLGADEPFKAITVPHDAMFYEPRTEIAKGGRNIGFFEGHDYIYRKEFHANTEWKNNRILIEFEGVYHNAEVYLNKSHIIIRLRNPYLPVFESDKRLIETDKLIWFPAKNPAKNSLAGFLF